MSWASAKLVPRDTLTWVQVERGPAQGIWLRLNPRTGRAVFEGGGEIAVQEALGRYLRPGMTFYDIGANIGFFSLLAARLVGKEGRIVAFEADPEVAARLREHVARNEFEQITVEEKAVWSVTGPLTFGRADPASSPDRGLGHVVPAESREAIHREGISLDDYARSEPQPDFVKCDVEGSEVEVFRGSQRLLKEKRPGIICEMHNEENCGVLLEEFSRLGYNCTRCDESHVLALPK